MIQDQHKNILSNYYENSVKKAIDYLETKYSLLDCERNDNDVPEIIQSSKQYNKFYKIEINLLSKSFILILAFPKSFPDTFPKIYLSKKNYQEIYPIPHIDKNRFICTRDPEIVSLSDKKTGEAIEKLIEIALEILEKGIKGENKEDFIKEFLAYWNDESCHFLLSLFTPIEDCKQLYIFKLSKEFLGCRLILSESKERLMKWLNPFDVEIENEEYKVLYIPLSRFNPYLLDNNKDLLAILSNPVNKNYLKEVENFFNGSINNNIIISSFYIEGERILFGWKHKRFRVKQFKGGFRSSYVPLQIRLADPKIRNKPIEKIEIIRLDKGRIFKRGGAITTFLKKDNSIALAGCGSLGSYLAMSLSRCGISNFILIDNEYLLPENTPRHLCGFLEASLKMKKVDAVKKRLTEHFPHLECKTYSNDFLQLLQEEEINLEKCDLLIIAIGKISLERRINFLQRRGVIDCPVVYMWIEPFGIGGHILYVHPNEYGCYECCFDNNGIFKYSIARSDEQFQKRESGCQSTFIPYSSLQIEQFISIASKKILTVLDKGLKESILYTWIGDIKEFEDMKFRINPMYVTKSPYSIIERKILSQETCEVCGKEELNI